MEGGVQKRQAARRLYAQRAMASAGEMPVAQCGAATLLKEGCCQDVSNAQRNERRPPSPLQVGAVNGVKGKGQPSPSLTAQSTVRDPERARCAGRYAGGVRVDSASAARWWCKWPFAGRWAAAPPAGVRLRGGHARAARVVMVWPCRVARWVLHPRIASKVGHVVPKCGV